MSFQDFSFSLTEESCGQIKELIQTYAEDVRRAIHEFQDPLIERASQRTHQKLVRAIDGIIELYNDSVRFALKRAVLDKWQDQCQSMVDYARTMGMGEESEAAAADLQDAISELFDVSVENRIREIHGETPIGARGSDFEAAKESFAAASKQVERLSEELLSQAEELSEQNTFYQFLIPVIHAYCSGIRSFFHAAECKLGELQENYVDKLKEQYQSAKDTGAQTVPLDLSAFLYAGMGTKKRQTTNRPRPDPTPAPVMSQNSPLPESQAAVLFSEESPEDSPYRELIDALMGFKGSKCAFLKVNVQKARKKHLEKRHQKLKEDLQKFGSQIDAKLQAYQDELKRNLQAEQAKLQKWYDLGLILGNVAELFYSHRFEKIYQQFEERKAFLTDQHNAKKAQCQETFLYIQRQADQRERVLLANAAACKKLYHKRKEFCARLEKGEHCLGEIEQYLQAIQCSSAGNCPELKPLLDAFRISKTAVQPYQHLFEQPADVTFNSHYSSKQDALLDIFKKKQKEPGADHTDEMFRQYQICDPNEQQQLRTFIDTYEKYKSKPYSPQLVQSYVRKQYQTLNQSATIRCDAIDFAFAFLPWETEQQQRQFLRDDFVAQTCSYVGVSCGQFTNFDQSYRTVLQQRKDNALPRAKQIFERLAPELRIIRDDYYEVDSNGKKRPAHYSPAKNGVFYNAKEDTSNPKGAGATFYHELGHMIDNKLAERNGGHGPKISRDPRFTQALEKDKQRLIQACRTPAVMAYLKSLLQQNCTYALSDIIGGMQIHKEFGDAKRWGRYGHDESYWARPYSLESETFANMFEASMGDADKQKLLAKYLPNTWQVFEQLLNQYGG